MGTFALQLQEFVDLAKANTETVVKKIGIEVLTGVVLKSPVDTGRFRANWVVGFDAVGKTSQATDKGGTQAIRRGTNEIMRVKLGETIWISNSLPYARRLEYGWSGQAPNGMVRVTVAEWRSFIDKAVAELKK